MALELDVSRGADCLDGSFSRSVSLQVALFEELFDTLRMVNYKATLPTVMKGFLDESHHKYVFTFCGLMAKGPTWGWFIADWLNCIEEKNRELKKAGRKTLSRYHATDCSTRYKEFKGWSVDEQIEFTKRLIEVFRRPANGVTVFSFSLSLTTLQEVIPESSPDPVAVAYLLMLMFLVDEIHKQIHEANKGEYL